MVLQESNDYLIYIHAGYKFHPTCIGRQTLYKMCGIMNNGVRFYTLDWIVLAGYFVLTMGIGFYFYRKTRSTEGFTAANRSLPGWVCGLSIFATYLSSISYLANPGKSFASNWNPFVFSLSLPLATLIGVRFFLPYYRKTGYVSAYRMLENRFGLWARIYASAVFYLPTQLARIAVVMYLTALPLQMIFGWNIYAVLVFIGVCVTLYSFVGGLMAVIWNDSIQALVLMAGAFIAVIVILATMPGGVGHMFDVTAEQSKFSLGELGVSVNETGSLHIDLGAATVLVVLLYGVAINLQNFGVDQSYIQRYIASKSDAEARRGLWLAGLLYVPISALFFFIGTTLYAHYRADQYTPEITDTAAVKTDGSGTGKESKDIQTSRDLQQVLRLVARQELVQEGKDENTPGFDDEVTHRARTLGLESARRALAKDGITKDDPEYEQKLLDKTRKTALAKIGDRAFPHFIAAHLPQGLTGLLIAAVFAAAMSTISTSINSSSTLIMSDYYQRLINPQAGERQSMIVLYGSTILWGVLGTALAFVLVAITQSALDIWWTLSGMFGAGITGLFLLGLISKRAKNPAAVTGVVLGLILILWMSVPKIAEYLMRFTKGSGVYRWGAALKQLTEGWNSPFHAFLIPVFGLLTIMLVGILVSTISGRPPSSVEDAKKQ